MELDVTSMIKPNGEVGGCRKRKPGTKIKREK